MNVSPWQVFVDEMYDRFGRRDPDCFWCGETVYMSLQGFFSGGRWTTEKDLEGPGRPRIAASAARRRLMTSTMFSFRALVGHDVRGYVPQTVMRPVGIEPTTSGSGGQRSIP